MKISNDSVEYENSIRSEYFMGYQEYSESKLMMSQDEDGFCYRCNKPLKTLTLLEPDFYYLPCWDCAEKKRRSEKIALTEGIIRNIKDFYSKILGDRYFQLFIVDDIYYRTTFPHDYSVFKKVVNSLEPPSRNDIWFLDWIPGYPKIISIDNLKGIKIVNLTKYYETIELGKDIIKIGDYEIHMPEETKTDSKHQSRYSLFSAKSDRRSKRLKVGDRYIKFYNTDEDSVKSIFKLTKNGEEVCIGTLSYQDFVIIKLAIMRDKSFLRLVFDIITEILKCTGTIKDTVFLKNTILLDPKKNDINLNLLWTPLSRYKEDNNINISIL